MICLLFREINYLLFARTFIYLILIEITDISQGMTSNIYIYCFLFCDYGIVITLIYQTQVEMDIARFFNDDRRNLDMLYDYILI